jgi:ribosome-binding factor A
MRKQPNAASGIQALVHQVREGDGLNPRDEAKLKLRRSRNLLPGEEFHQQERLACQIRTAVDFALQAASSPILNALTVHNVVRQKGTIVVVLLPRDASQPVDIVQSAAALKRAEGMLRREVAAAITRKEAPNLRFIVLPGGTEQTEGDDRG